MLKGYAEPLNIISGSSLVVGGKANFSDPLPMGEGWHLMMLSINLALTIGTGSGAIAESELNIIKNILFKTDKGEVICNLPGRALYKIGVTKAGTTLTKDAMAAATATYRVNIPIFFVDYKMRRPEDTILDTKRYSSCTLEITLGTVADLLTTVGTSSLTATLDVEIHRVKGTLPKELEPRAYISYDVKAPVDASVVTQVLLERAQDLAIKRYYVHSGTGGTAGVPFSGVNSDAVQDVVNIKDQSGFIVKDRIHRMINAENKMRYGLETALVGIEVHDFVTDGDLESSLVTAGKNLLQYSFTNQSGVASGYLVSVAHEGVRKLRG